MGLLGRVSQTRAPRTQAQVLGDKDEGTAQSKVPKLPSASPVTRTVWAAPWTHRERGIGSRHPEVRPPRVSLGPAP